MEFDRRHRLVSSRSLPLYGLTLERETDREYGLRALRLCLRGKAIEVARGLAPAEKAAFAEDFEQALRAAGCALWRRDIVTPAVGQAV